ncbi:MAG: N-acetylmuramoyl-L-alanine amidase [Clostridia bacterium]|nr:N-acetylmuramoyl-L-alanine amidase [Clostridia bacterium]
MIVIVKKNNIVLIALFFLLCIALYSLNLGNQHSASANTVRSTEKVVMIDPGHGGEDPGAVSDYNGIKEKDINLGIASYLRELLEQDGYKVIMTREEDKLEYEPGTRNIIQKRKQDLLRRKKMMDEGGANIVVSIHLNKFPQTQYFGAQTFFPPNSPESQKLAHSIQMSIREMVDPQNKREALVKKEPIIILKNNKTTTAIVECGFLSNPEEEKKLGSTQYQQNLSAAIKKGIDAYFASKIN